MLIESNFTSKSGILAMVCMRRPKNDYIADLPCEVYIRHYGEDAWADERIRYVGLVKPKYDRPERIVFAHTAFFTTEAYLEDI